jgi:hypothetical protein
MNLEDCYQSLSLKNGALFVYRDGKFTLLDILPLEILNRRLSYMSHNVTYNGELITMTIGQNISFKDNILMTECNKSKTIPMPPYSHKLTTVNTNDEILPKVVNNNNNNDRSQLIAVTIPILLEDTSFVTEENNLDKDKVILKDDDFSEIIIETRSDDNTEINIKQNEETFTPIEAAITDTFTPIEAAITDTFTPIEAAITDTFTPIEPVTKSDDIVYNSSKDDDKSIQSQTHKNTKQKSNSKRHKTKKNKNKRKV